MIYGHISAKETEKAYAPRILEAIRYCRETDVSHMGESRFLLDGDRLIAQICDRVTEAKEKKLPGGTPQIRRAAVHGRGPGADGILS